MSSEIEVAEAELAAYKIELESVQSSLQNEPDRQDLQDLENDIRSIIIETENLIAELKPKVAPKAPTPPPTEKPKWSVENHPAYQGGLRKPPPPPPEEAKPTAFKVNDKVLAKWISGNQGFYPARITSVTGSSSNPIYYVTFQSYGTTETLRAGDIKAMGNDSKKRKADGTPVSNTPPVVSNPNVISAAASIDPTLASAAKKEPSKVSDGPLRPAKIPKQIKPKKELETSKSKWLEFSTKGKKSKSSKESMFRTSESVNSRVGFTGSGQAMRKDATRSRHVYQPTADDDAY